ncbi:MAG: alpha-amylase family glycosyl hydrolase, partial [Oscillospiraceae bacterium]
MDGCPFVCFDSLSVDFVSPIGAVPAGQEITFCVRLIKRAGAHSPRLLVYEADQWENPAAILPMMPLRDEPTVVWYVTHFLPQRPSLLFYRFDAQVGDGRQSILRGDDSTGKLNPWNGKHWQLTVYDAKMRQPSALTGGLIYQIFPDRFYSSKTKKEHVPSDRILRDDWGAMPSWRPNEQGKVLCNDYFGGDLEGIREKLPYLKSLGVTVIYLNPIFEAQSNHRYNTADYTKIDPLLGSEADFKALCADARKVDISVILDGVFSHTGSDSIYFNREGRYKGGAYRDRKSPYLSWFKFEKWPESYKSWWGIDTLPEVVETDPSYLDFITGENGVIDHWMKAGAAGFRLDVADELPDLALDAICAAVRRQDAEAPVIGEVWEDASNKMSYGIRRRYLLGNQLSSVMNYPLTDAILAFVRQGDAYSLFSVLL